MANSSSIFKATHSSSKELLLGQEIKNPQTAIDLKSFFSKWRNEVTHRGDEDMKKMNKCVSAFKEKVDILNESLTNEELIRRCQELQVCVGWLNEKVPLCDEKGSPFYSYEGSVSTKKNPLKWAIATPTWPEISLNIPKSVIYDFRLGNSEEAFGFDSEKNHQTIKAIISIIEGSGLEVSCDITDSTIMHTIFITNEIYIKNLIVNKKLAEEFKKQPHTYTPLLPPLVNICASYLHDEDEKPTFKR